MATRLLPGSNLLEWLRPVGASRYALQKGQPCLGERPGQTAQDGHSRRPVASPPSSRPPCSPHRPSPVSISIAASRRRASPDRSPTMARRTPERIPAPPRAPEAPFVRSSNQPRRSARAPSRASPSRSRNFPGSIRIWRSSAHFSPQRAQGETSLATCAPTQSSCHVCYGRRRRPLMS